MKLANYIDHTILKADATCNQIVKLCEEAKENGFASVCVNPYYVTTASKELKGSDVKVCTVVGFPLGANTKEVKAFETTNAIENGAQEIDMVLNVGAMKNEDYDTVSKDIEAVVLAAKEKALVKVILETCYLTPAEIEKACLLAVEAGAQFVKTSTGFGTYGAKVEDVALMAKTVAGKAQVKASGGIKTYDDANKMIEAGATRLGTSAGIEIVNAQKLEE